MVKVRSKSPGMVSWLGPIIFILAFSVPGALGKSFEITVKPVESVRSGSLQQTTEKKPGQIPHSRVVRGTRNITETWLAGPTNRYPHGVLGDDLEASRLIATDRKGVHLFVELPSERVFEDLFPRLADLDKDGDDELIIVESDAGLGASLAVYGTGVNGLEKRSATPFLGRPNRWLNPLGVGDFNGDGQLDLALVATPHIGGILRLYTYRQGIMAVYAEFRAVSTHRIGSTALGLGQVVDNGAKDLILLPEQSWQALLLLEWESDRLRIRAKAALPSRLASSLVPAGKDRWTVQLENGRPYEIRLIRLLKNHLETE